MYPSHAAAVCSIAEHFAWGPSLPRPFGTAGSSQLHSLSVPHPAAFPQPQLRSPPPSSPVIAHQPPPRRRGHESSEGGLATFFVCLVSPLVCLLRPGVRFLSARCRPESLRRNIHTPTGHPHPKDQGLKRYSGPASKLSVCSLGIQRRPSHRNEASPSPRDLRRGRDHLSPVPVCGRP